ncbi:MAG: hypothetical protein ACOH1K_04170 [Rhodoglobus sp.]
MTTTPEQQPEAEEPQQSAPEPARQPLLVSSVESNDVTIRRAPKFGAFMIVGGGVGAIATFVLTMAFPVDPSVGFGPLFGYFSLFGIPVGVALAAIVALIIDRSSSRRSRAATVEHETVEPESFEGTLE